MLTMPRQIRIRYPGAIYHLMSQGDRRQDVLLDVDRQEFIKTLAETCPKTGWRLTRGAVWSGTRRHGCI